MVECERMGTSPFQNGNVYLHCMPGFRCILKLKLGRYIPLLSPRIVIIQKTEISPTCFVPMCLGSTGQINIPFVHVTAFTITEQHMQKLHWCNARGVCLYT